MADCTTEVAKKAQENFVKENRVFILGPFDRSISSNVIPELVELIDSIKHVKDPEIEFYINSYGGYTAELFSLMACVDMAKSAGIKVITYNIGAAYSCGSMLAVIGDERYMYRYATNLPHLGQAGIAPQTVEQLERGTKHIAEHFSTIFEIYKQHTKLSHKELIKILKDDDCYLTSEECLKYGFCDKII